MLQRKSLGYLDQLKPKRILRHVVLSQTFSVCFVGFMWYRLKVNDKFRYSCHHNAPFILNLFYRSLYYIEGDGQKKKDYEAWGLECKD